MMKWGFSLALLLLVSGAANAGTLEDIKARGTLSCGVEENRTAISVVKDGKAKGLAADLCASLAAAVLGRADAVGFVAVTQADAFATLQAEEVDVLLVPLPWRFSDEVEQGVMLVQPLLSHKDGTVFGPTVRHGDDGWFSVVRWLLFALQSDGKIDGAKGTTIGLSAQWAENAIAARGPYAAMVTEVKDALEQSGFQVLPRSVGPQF
jgi:hypothetical protein